MRFDEDDELLVQMSKDVVTKHQVNLFPVSGHKLRFVQVYVDLLDRRLSPISTRPVIQFIPVGLQMLHPLLCKQFMNDLVEHFQIFAFKLQLDRLLLDLIQRRLIVAHFSAYDNLLQELSK